MMTPTGQDEYCAIAVQSVWKDIRLMRRWRTAQTQIAYTPFTKHVFYLGCYLKLPLINSVLVVDRRSCLLTAARVSQKKYSVQYNDII